MTTGSKILVTGADGYIGGMVCQRLLQQTDAELVLWVRADDEAERAHKQQQLKEHFDDHWPRIQFACGNLQQAEPFAAVNPQAIACIIHIAAITAFTVSAEQADAVNREGSRKLFSFARQCPQLERLAYVSTVFSSGKAAGDLKEEPWPVSGPFANHYERSKAEAENLLINEFNDLPWHIYRVATVIAHNDEGDVEQYNVFHNTLRLLYYGLISTLPGYPETPVYFVTGEFVADAISELSQAQTEARIFHLCHALDDCLSLGELIDTAFKAFEEDPGFRKRRILRPLMTDLETFELVAEGTAGLTGEIVSQAISSIKPFAPQMFIHKAFDNSQLRTALSHYRSPTADLVSRTVRYLQASKWGRNS